MNKQLGLPINPQYCHSCWRLMYYTFDYDRHYLICKECRERPTKANNSTIRSGNPVIQFIRFISRICQIIKGKDYLDLDD